MTPYQVGQIIDVCNARKAEYRDDWTFRDVMQDVEKRGLKAVYDEVNGAGRKSSNRKLKGLK
jgi:hypothetical protein